MKKITGGLRRLDWAAGGERLVLTSVLAIAALISYTHLREVFIAAGSPWADVGPASVDGLFASAWLRMRRRRRQGSPVGALAWLALGLALVTTTAGNVTAAWLAGHTDTIGIVVAAWPALAFALVWELVTGHSRQAAGEPASEAPELPVSLVDRARELVEAGAGRPTLAKELGIKPSQARTLIARVRQPAGEDSA